MFEPLYDRVLIEEIKEEEKKVGSIILPSSSKEKYGRGKLVAVGKGRYELGHFIETHVKVGDTVLFDLNASQEVTLDGKELLMLRENAIMGTFKEGK